MKVAVCASGRGLDAPLDERFGRCPWFIVFDTESGEVRSVENPGASSAGGAGPGSARTILGLGVEGVIAGRVGPNAEEVLKEAGITVFAGEGATVREAVERLAEGKLERIL